jgi:hypothetical protein
MSATKEIMQRTGITNLLVLMVGSIQPFLFVSQLLIIQSFNFVHHLKVKWISEFKHR